MEDPKLARVDPGPDSVVNPADCFSSGFFVYSADPVAALVHTKVDHPASSRFFGRSGSGGVENPTGGTFRSISSIRQTAYLERGEGEATASTAGQE